MITREQIVEEIVPQIPQDNFREVITSMMQKDELTKMKLERNSNVYMDKMLELSGVINIIHEISTSRMRESVKSRVIKELTDPMNIGAYGDSSIFMFWLKNACFQDVEKVELERIFGKRIFIPKELENIFN